MKRLSSIFGVDAEGGPIIGRQHLFDESVKSRSPKRRELLEALPAKRATMIIVATLLLISAVYSRVAYLQIVKGEEFRARAEGNRTRIVAMPAHRGIIVDRFGEPLAENAPIFRLTAQVVNWPKDPALKEEAQQYLEGKGKWTDELTRSLKDPTKSIASLLLWDDMPYEEALLFEASKDKYPGLSLELTERRIYQTTTIPTLAHILGYVGTVSEEEYETLEGEGYRQFDSVGKSGLEKKYETDLRGIFGREVREVDAAGKTIRTISKTDAVAGRDLTLTIDAAFQKEIERILDNNFTDLEGGGRASVVALDPRNGEVLALVSYPGFDANLFSGGISQEAYAALLNDPRDPLFARAAQGEYPSGSTIKPLFAAGGLTDGKITPSTTVVSTGGVWLGDRFFPDWRAGGHGVTNVFHAIADSVNTFFYYLGGGSEVADGLGIERLMEWASAFGLGEPSGIDLPQESAGFLPSKEWKQEVKGEPWYIGDTYNVAIGQGDLLVSPLQMARAIGAIANEGKLYVPKLVKDQETPDPEMVITPEVAAIVGQGMRQTVTAGSAPSLQSIPVPVAGKTGTAQWSSNNEPHSWFVGYAPYEDPQLVIAVIIEEGADKGRAITVSRELLSWYFGSRTSPEPAPRLLSALP